VAADRDTRLVPNIRMSKRMKPFVRHLAIAAGYVRAVEAIWRRHGLGSRVGLAFDYLKGDKGENIESRFQRLGRLALAAVGDRSGVSRWQVKKVKLRAKNVR
jgi:hypothetical protein